MDLPGDILWTIFLLFDKVSDVGRARLVCKRWAALLSIEVITVYHKYGKRDPWKHDPWTLDVIPGNELIYFIVIGERMVLRQWQSNNPIKGARDPHHKRIGPYATSDSREDIEDAIYDLYVLIMTFDDEQRESKREVLSTRTRGGRRLLDLILDTPFPEDRYLCVSKSGRSHRRTYKLSFRSKGQILTEGRHIGPYRRLRDIFYPSEKLDQLLSRCGEHGEELLEAIYEIL